MKNREEKRAYGMCERLLSYLVSLPPLPHSFFHPFFLSVSRFLILSHNRLAASASASASASLTAFSLPPSLPCVPLRSLIAHEDSVTCVRFQPDTHYFFSGGKDGVLKYWDADRYTPLTLLPLFTSPSFSSITTSGYPSFVHPANPTTHACLTIALGSSGAVTCTTTVPACCICHTSQRTIHHILSRTHTHTHTHAHATRTLSIVHFSCNKSKCRHIRRPSPYQ